jgi:hypothetical protein
MIPCNSYQPPKYRTCSKHNTGECDERVISIKTEGGDYGNVDQEADKGHDEKSEVESIAFPDQLTEHGGY